MANLTDHSRCLEDLLSKYLNTHPLDGSVDLGWIDRACRDQPHLKHRLAAMVEDVYRGHNILDALNEPPMDNLHNVFSRLAGGVCLERPVGGGGFGYVYRGVQQCPGTEYRPVAVKFFRKTHVAKESFDKEFRLLTGLEANTRIPKAYLAGEIGGFRYLVMSWVPGASLEQVIRHRAEAVKRKERDRLFDKTEIHAVLEGVLRTLKAASRIYRQTWASLGKAELSLWTPQVGVDRFKPHRAPPLVHGDLKPSNILVRDYKPGERIKSSQLVVLDFGTAQFLDMPLSGLTREYVSPEMLMPGHGKALTGASDVFQVGLIGYEMLTGRRYWQLHPNDRLRELRRCIRSTPLRTAITKALDWNPYSRFRSADSFLTYLKNPLVYFLRPSQLFAWFRSLWLRRR